MTVSLSQQCAPHQTLFSVLTLPPWAQEIFDLLLAMAKAAERWRRQGARAIPKEERDDWIAQYFAVLASGFAVHWAQAPPMSSASPKKSGRKKQDASKNLLDALLQRAEHVLAFLDDLCVPFTNNLAERSVRPLVIARKISGFPLWNLDRSTPQSLPPMFGCSCYHIFLRSSLNSFHFSAPLRHRPHI